MTTIQSDSEVEAPAANSTPGLMIGGTVPGLFDFSSSGPGCAVEGTIDSIFSAGDGVTKSGLSIGHAIITDASSAPEIQSTGAAIFGIGDESAAESTGATLFGYPGPDTAFCDSFGRASLEADLNHPFKSDGLPGPERKKSEYGESAGSLKLILEDKTEILCSALIIHKSEALRNLCNFCEECPEPIPLPNFVSKEILREIMNIIDGNNDCQKFVNAEMIHHIRAIQCVDFLMINEVTCTLIEMMEEKISIDNAFELFPMINHLTVFCDIARKCMKIIMFNIEQYYLSSMATKALQDQDPYLEKYKLLKIDDIQMLLTFSKKNSTKAKILLFQNWWVNNKDLSEKDEVFAILQQINIDAAYIPRHEIKFMRQIRDVIIEEIVELGFLKNRILLNCTLQICGFILVPT